jgi:GAF domain-containing protein
MSQQTGTISMTDDAALHALVDIYEDLGRQIAAEPKASGALLAVTTVTARALPGADAVSITRKRAGSFQTVASTDDAASRADALQYEIGVGPCVDAVDKDNVFYSADLAADHRWGDFGPIAAESVGVRSVLSIRLSLEDREAMAGLNIYSRSPDAFDDRARQLAWLLSTHASVVVAELVAREKIANLEVALETSRDIGLAMGVLMISHKITREQAFDLLRIASQRSHRKLRDIANDVCESGTLDIA